MRPFIHDDFLLQSEASKWIYHEYAKDLPIIDYHCHLPPTEIAANQSYETMTDIWLAGDHYKWRALRNFGVDEYYITGNAPKEEKFQKWASIVPKTIGNPLYHWTHLELKRYFGIDVLLNESNWKEVWEESNRLLQQDDFKAQALIKRSNVEAICTTDDPLDSLEHHQSIANQTNFDTKVLPTLRPDQLIEIGVAGFVDYLTKVEARYQVEVTTWENMKQLIDTIVEAFHQQGSRLADHGLQHLPFTRSNATQLEQILLKRRQGDSLSKLEVEQYKTEMLIEFAHAYHKRGWVMQWHIGAIRDNNKRMFDILGKDSGFDSIDDFHLAAPLNNLLNAIDATDQLPQTIIYNLNPNHNEVIASAIGNFQTGGMVGKVQFGSGWWFNDQKRGMERQLNDLAHFGFLASFVGMLTDSRSMLSYTRHEYFRRILANLLGEWIGEGLIPNDRELVGQIMSDVSYHNAKGYFPF